MSIQRVQTVPYTVAGFGDKFTHDFAARSAQSEPFFGRQTWRDVLEKISKRSYPRAQLCDALESRARKLNAPEAVFASIKALRDTNTYAVVTGQQAGLLGGPLLTLHKALTAVRLARQYEAESGGKARFVPVFWVAADDHDLAEIDHAWIVGESGELHRVQAGAPSDSVGVSAARIRIDVDNGPSGAMRAQLEKAGIASDKAAEITRFYGNEPMADVFARQMLQWLGGLGLIVAHSADIRPLGRELLLAELERHAGTTRLISDAGDAMRKLGYTAGFPKPHQGPHFFIETSGDVRAALVWDEAAKVYRERSGAFALRGLQAKTYTRDELSKLIETSPPRFSASAALRPVLQQAVFPVVSVALGPGEIAYWAQLKGVHDQFNVPWPHVLPRASATLIDGTGEKVIRKLEMLDRIADIFGDTEKLKSNVYSEKAASARLKERRERILAELDAAANDVKALAGGLDQMLHKVRSRFVHELERIESRVGQVLSEQEGVGERRLQYLSSLVRPRNSPQERVLCTAAFMLRHPQLPVDLLEVFDPAIREHFVITLG
ncbi:MAG TPA: bacillithiol biosynthesis cysteine-adding enzyme BshC [Planctomycetota bacterium]|nr:bacillithiol biosynthesis cysteine-adding enzyme BshC [Planctomycetota bacterium]